MHPSVILEKGEFIIILKEFKQKLWIYERIVRVFHIFFTVPLFGKQSNFPWEENKVTSGKSRR
jgi:hypothetical protein